MPKAWNGANSLCG